MSVQSAAGAGEAPATSRREAVARRRLRKVFIDVLYFSLLAWQDMIH